MAERLPHPVHTTAAIGKRLSVLRATRDDEGVEERAALTLPVMVCSISHTLSDFLSDRVDRAATGSHNPCSCQTGPEQGADRHHIAEVETVCNQDGNPA